MELLIAMAIAGVALAAVFSSLLVGDQVEHSQRSHGRRAAESSHERGLHGAGPAHGRPRPLRHRRRRYRVRDHSSIRFTADRNMNGAINDADLSDGIQEADLERITYAYDAGNRRLRQCLSRDPKRSLGYGGRECHRASSSPTSTGTTSSCSVAAADLTRIRSVDLSMSVTEPAGFKRTVSRTLTKRILLPQPLLLNG